MFISNLKKYACANTNNYQESPPLFKVSKNVVFYRKVTVTPIDIVSKFLCGPARSPCYAWDVVCPSRRWAPDTSVRSPWAPVRYRLTQPVI